MPKSEQPKRNKIKAVVTGGAGFIGHHLVNFLIERGVVVTVVDNLVAGKRERVNPSAQLMLADVRDREVLAPAFAGADYVFHLAALPRVQYSIEYPVETHEVNVTGTMNVLLAAREAKVKRVVYSSSSSAYGDSVALPLREDLPANPKSPYGLHKYLGELYCRVITEVYGLPTVSLRYFNVYGSGQDPDGPYALVIGRFLKQRANGEPLSITGDGEQTRDFTHVRDVVRANWLAATSKRVGRGEVLNIGAGNNISINKLAALIGGPVVHIPARLEPKHTLADITRAKELLGWQPEIVFEQGLKELLG